MFEIVNVDTGRSQLAASILRALPDWFGIPAAVDAYIADSEHLPVFGARMTKGGTFTGFLTLKRHTPAAAEILVMGVLREHHRHGVGRALIAAAERHLKGEGARYLTVKTLAASHPDPGYAKTRKFYEAVGFDPIEEFPTLWGPDNPCLFMLKRVG